MEGHASRRTSSEIRAYLTEQIARQLGVPSAEIDPRRPFVDFGLSSADAVGISGDLGSLLGMELSPTLLWDHPNIEALASHLSGIGELVGESSGTDRERTGREPIAVVGMSCRFPGAPDIENFWRLLRDGRDAIGEVPPARWNVDAWYDTDPSAAGKMATRWGGFVHGVDLFDPGFFGISPREAARMDPQQRLVLEVAWEAIEGAGHAPDRLRGSSTGVFIGISTNDYASIQMTEPALVDAYAGTGNAHSICANRVSYLLDLRGPSLAVDTACSSSLVAVHQACQALRAGECDLALAGGVNLILTPQLTIAFSKAGMMAADGRCKTFDERADGYVRGEGCGVLLLRGLADALADGDQVLAVIRGSSINQDGLTNGLTAPNALAQQAVIRQALRSAGVLAADIGYVEAHGTGTPLGDPIEIDALKAVLVPGRPADRPCAIGSVKTNIGHLEAAAGVAGLIKTILVLRHAEIPPHLHLTKLNRRIVLEGTPLQIPTERRAWPPGESPRRAGVSSFGFGGTNAHVVLEEAPPRPSSGRASRNGHLLSLSARDGKALRDLAGRWTERIGSLGDAGVEDACAVSRHGRVAFRHRLALAAESPAELRRALDAFMAGEPPLGFATGEVGNSPVRVGFLFTGQGAQYADMGRRLHASEPVFRETLERCAEMFDGLLPARLLGVMWPAPGGARLLERTDFTQAALFALEVSLAALLRSWGVQPDAAAGHSIGAYAAACSCGVLALGEGVRLVAERGRLMQSLPAGGQMVAVMAGEERVADAVARWPDEVSIAAVNGPGETVVSGAAHAVAAVARQLEAAGVKCVPLDVARAFHSPLMSPILEQFESVARSARFAPPAIPFISDTTGESADADLVTSPGYWSRHIREPVRFGRAVETMHALGCRVFVEIGPRPTLLGIARRCLPPDGAVFVPTLRKGADDTLLTTLALGSLWSAGAAVDWNGFDAARSPRRVSMPTYPFQRRRCWLDEGAAPRPASAPEPQVVYAVDWEERNAPPRDGMRKGLRLIFADSGGIASRLKSRLEARGETCITVTAGRGFEEIGPACFALDPSDSEGLSRLWGQVIGRGDVPVLGAVDCWPLDIPENGDGAVAQRLGLSPVLALARILTAGSPLPRLHVVTRRAQQVLAGEAPRPLQALLWGLGRSLALEAPAAWGGLIDIDDDCSDDALISALDDGEDQVAVRGGHRLVARLVSREAPAGEGWRPRREAAYLITGGLGSLGRAVAGWLADLGARHLVLLGRRGADGPGRPQAVAALEERGVSVRVIAADASDMGRMRALLEGWDGPPLGGIFHLAGVAAPMPFQEIGPRVLANVLSPKVDGALALHRFTSGHDLDCFVLFSSVSSVLGSANLAHYAASNAFLDALAQARRASGLPALSISWGPWDQDGMTSQKDRQQLSRFGMDALSPPSALALLGRLLGSNVAHAAVARIHMGKFLPAYEVRGRRPFMERLAPTEDPTPAPGAPPPLRLEIEQAPETRRKEILLAWMSGQLARILGLEGAGQVDPHQGFFEMGLDSLMALELKDLLEKLLGTRLPRTVAFEHPTPAELAEYLVRGHLQRDAGPSETAVAGTDVEALLERELQRLKAMGVLTAGSS